MEARQAARGQDLLLISEGWMEANEKHHRGPMDTPAYAQHSTRAGVMATESGLGV